MHSHATSFSSASPPIASSNNIIPSQRQLRGVALAIDTDFEDQLALYDSKDEDFFEDFEMKPYVEEFDSSEDYEMEPYEEDFEARRGRQSTKTAPKPATKPSTTKKGVKCDGETYCQSYTL